MGVGVSVGISTGDAGAAYKQPSFLKTLFLSETAGNFSHYGMRNLLVLYMISDLLFSDSRAYEVYASFVAVLYITPLLGGTLADRYFSLKSLLILGACFVIIGTVLLALINQEFFFIGLGLVSIGYGLYRPSILRMLSRLYGDTNDPRRESGFTIFFTASNLGPLFASILCSWVAVTYGWHWGFSLAATSMIVSITILLFHQSEISILDQRVSGKSLSNEWMKIFMLGLPLALVICVVSAYLVYRNDLFHGAVALVFFIIAVFIVRMLLTSGERESRLRILVILILLIYHMTFFSFFEQLSSSVTLFVDRVVIRNVYDFTMPTLWFQSLNPTFIVLLGPIFSSLWIFLRRRNHDLTVSAKFITAFLMISAGFYTLSYGSIVADCDGRVNMYWLVAGIFLHSVGEILIAPIALSTITRLSPAHRHGFFIGLFYFSVAVGNYFAGFIAKWTAIDREPGALVKAMDCVNIYQGVFLKIGFYAFLAAISILFFYPFINERLIRTKG